MFNFKSTPHIFLLQFQNSEDNLSSYLTVKKNFHRDRDSEQSEIYWSEKSPATAVKKNGGGPSGELPRIPVRTGYSRIEWFSDWL